MTVQSMGVPITVCLAGMREPERILMRPGETVRQALDRTRAERGVPPFVRALGTSPAAAPKRDVQLEEHQRATAALKAEHERLLQENAALQQQIEQRQTSASSAERQQRHRRGLASAIRINRSGLNVFKRKK